MRLSAGDKIKEAALVLFFIPFQAIMYVGVFLLTDARRPWLFSLLLMLTLLGLTAGAVFRCLRVHSEWEATVVGLNSKRGRPVWPWQDFESFGWVDGQLQLRLKRSRGGKVSLWDVPSSEQTKADGFLRQRLPEVLKRLRG
jgi:hypothetical protein